MDPAILLDTFPPVDMDMWHSCNSFLVEENLGNGLKLDHSHHHQTDGASSDSSFSSSSSSPTEIKEEHIATAAVAAAAAVAVSPPQQQHSDSSSSSSSSSAVSSDAESENGPSSSQTNFSSSIYGGMARSKTGTQVELTKVRPFVRKLDPNPVFTSKTKKQKICQLESPSSSETNSSSPQIIVLNISPSQSNSNILNSELNVDSKLKGINYRVLSAATSSSTQSTSSSTSPTKLPARFRVVNPNNRATNHSSVIKLSPA